MHNEFLTALPVGLIHAKSVLSPLLGNISPQSVQGCKKKI